MSYQPIYTERYTPEDRVKSIAWAHGRLTNGDNPEVVIADLAEFLRQAEHPESVAEATDAIRPTAVPTIIEEDDSAFDDLFMAPTAQASFFESIATPLLARGLKVAPCYPNSKLVHGRLVPEPLEQQSNDPAQIRAWGLREPQANVCVYAQQVEGGLCFVDKDGAISLVEKYERETGKTFPRTLLVRSSVAANGTPKGHWYFRQTAATMALPGNIPESKTDGLFSLRVANYYVCSIGSIHPETREAYAIADDAPIIPMPDDFLQWLLGHVKEAPKTRQESAERKFPKGTRYNALISEAGRLWSNGHSREMTITASVDWARKHFEVIEGAFNESMVRKEVEHLLDSYEQGKPVPGLIMAPSATTTGPEALVTKMSKFGKKKIYWLWRNRVPYGFLCTLAGDPDEGKSLITLYIAARVSRGEKLYDNTEDTAAAEVLILSAEDDPESTLRPRLEAVGADLDKIHLFESVQTRDGVGNTIAERLVQLDEDIQKIEKILDENPGIKLVIIDPISSFLGAASINREQEVRRVLQPLAKRARVSGLAVVMVAHFNKNSETRSAMDRVGGAKAIVGMGRSAWTCVREPEKEGKDGEPMPISDPDRRLFLKLKGNLAPSKIGGLVYTIKTTLVEVEGKNGPELVEQPYIVWIEQTERTAHEVVIGDKGSKPKKGSKAEEAKDWLHEFLESSGGYASANAIDTAAEAKGYGTTADGTLRRAKALLKLDTGWLGRDSYWGLRGAIPKPGALMEAGVNHPTQRKHQNTVELEPQLAR